METKNIAWAVIAVVVVLAFIFIGTRAGATDNANLYQKDANWERTGDGYGLITFIGNTFVFNGQNLTGEYSLIVFDTVAGDDDNDEWPGEGPVLATGVASEAGTLGLEGEVACLDEAKIWLVTASDVREDGTMRAWNPENYLFEHDRFTTCQELEVSSEPSIGDGEAGEQDTNCADLDALTEEQALGDCGISKVKPVVETLEVVEKVQEVQKEELVVFPSTGLNWF